MPTNPESLIIYAIVLLTLGWLTRGFWAPRKAKRACGHDCGCTSPRHPTIQRILDKKK